MRTPASPILPLMALSTAMLLSACVPQPPAPAPSPTATAIARPAPPPPSAQPARDWRDMPVTPGDWHWNRTATGSEAAFAGGQFIMRCNLAQHSVTLLRATTTVGGRVPISITTTDGTRALVTVPVVGGVAVTLPATDSLLDSMAFSRGRFAVETTGSPSLYIPSWTEISRVIEDCR